MPTPIFVPLLNPNEPEALIVQLHVKAGQFVNKDDLIATLETTKSASDLLAEEDGYISGLQLSQGEIGRAGEVFCYLAETPDWSPPIERVASRDDSNTRSQLPKALRITTPAEKLALSLGLDLEKLPTDRLITESVLQEFIRDWTPEKKAAELDDDFDRSALIVYGGGGHGKTLIDLLQAIGSYRVVGIIDDGIPAGERIMDIPILGGSEVLSRLYQQGIRQAVNAVGGIGDITIRVQVFQKLAAAGFMCPTVVHPSAVVEPSAILEAGVQIFAQSYVGSGSIVGFGCIVNTGAIVSHDCTLMQYANISPGAVLAGEVWVGSQSLIGMGATINLRVRVGNSVRIGNGATVKQDIPDKGFVRAGSIWPL